MRIQTTWTVVFVLMCCTGRAAHGVDDDNRQPAEATHSNVYSLTISVVSELPFPNVPVNPEIDFTSIIQDADLPGVLNPDSISVVNLSTGQVEPHSLSPEFRNSNRGHVRWLARNPAHTKYEIRFSTIESRTILKPARWTPLIGIGDLLRYNAGQARPASLAFPGRMADLTGDGVDDIVGCEMYTVEPQWPAERVPKGWGNIFCLPVLQSEGVLIVGDAIRLRYRNPGSDEFHLFDAGYLHGDVMDLNGDGLFDLTYSTHPKSSYTSTIEDVNDYVHVFLNTGVRDDAGMPVFERSPTRIPHPAGQWAPVRQVDLNNDGALDVVLGTMFSDTNTSATYLRNTNPDGWPIRPADSVRITTGNNASFFDINGDGQMDSICFMPDSRGARTFGSRRVAWRRNLKNTPPQFASPEVITDIDMSLPQLTASVRNTKHPGILVTGAFGANMAFYVHEDSTEATSPRFRRLDVKSVSAPVRAGDQATPFPCDWDHDGDWDLLVGGGFGIVKIILNQGTNDRPAFDEPQVVTAEGKPIEIFMSDIFPGLTGYYHDLGYVHPTYVDWDADGLPDLLLPNLSNRIFWHRNIGTLRNPRFGPRRQIICDGSPETHESLKASAKLLGAGTQQWTKRIPDPASPFWWRSRAAFGDFNGDGLTDIVTADASSPLSPNRFARHSRLFAQYRDTNGRLRLRKDQPITLPDSSLMENCSGSAAQMIAIDWDNDGRMDLLTNEGKTNFTCPALLRNIGTTTEPKFDFPRRLACFGEELNSIAKHGPYYGVADLDKDGKCDLLACTEAGTYLYFRGTAMAMSSPPELKLQKIRNITKP